ncbi:transcriptional repressor scratch 1-like [Pollicipes pollicipes]|uniref:transcriptional repressor scratch 1-like n=1 Tax=Pollicipes pollicipes TaxID=41117 RepID=UPI0018859042|nr:transcriptional repressor scratch 1-like [Pollicipes pollicipes]
MVKVEKVDLTEDDDDVSLDATLGYVAEYEGSYGEPDLSMSGHDSLMAGDAAAAMGALGAGPSQRLGEDGSAQGSHRCPVCGRTYLRHDTLTHHLKQHEGATRCMLCGKTLGNVFSLRRHMQCVHRVAVQDVRSIVPTRVRGPYEWEAEGRGEPSGPG